MSLIVEINSWAEYGAKLQKDPSTQIIIACLKFGAHIVEKDRTDKILTTIQLDIKTLIESSFLSGRKFLEAAYHAKNEEQRQLYLHDARRSFITASVTSAPVHRGKALRLVALCYDLLGDRPNAEAQYQEACEYVVAHYTATIDEMIDSEASTLVGMFLAISIIGIPIEYIWSKTRDYEKKLLREKAIALRVIASEIEDAVSARGIKIPHYANNLPDVPPV